MNISERARQLLLEVILATEVGGVLWLASPSLKDDRIVSVLSAIAAASGTLLGFLITAVTLLTAVMDRTLVANMRKTGHYQRLVRETFQSCGVLLATLVASVAAMFMSDAGLFITFCVVIGLATLSVLQMVETGVRFSRIFTLLS